MKEFFKTTKGIFVGITVILWIVLLPVTAMTAITLAEYLQAMGTVSIAVTALYNWYTKKEISKVNESLENKNTQLLVENQLKESKLNAKRQTKTKK